MSTEELGKKWVNLAQERLGCEVVFATDDFFAPKERLIGAGEPIFIPDKYDDHGKWMDGWESRRKRVAGHDHCIVKLGSRGLIKGFDINTQFFTGNFPPFAMIEACESGEKIPGDDANWKTIVPKIALKGDGHNWIAVEDDYAWTHIKLHIFPDGGVARLRVFGKVHKDWTGFDKTKVIDLLAVENGGRPIACNNEHYGIPANMIAPGRGINMGDGWETRRRREPGHDWAILELCAPGTVKEILVDTKHFKGNYPDRCFIQAANLSGVSEADIVKQAEKWQTLLPEQKLEMDKEHHFKTGIMDLGPITHVRLNIIPDGGVSRLRLFGTIA